MSKSRPKIDDRQLSIFQKLQELQDLTNDAHQEGQLAVTERLRAAIRAAIESCPLSRHQIAGEMSHLLGETITKEMIDSWTRESDELNGRRGRHIPAEYLPAFCKVTADIWPLQLLGRTAGVFVFEGPDALRSEIQKFDEEITKLKERKKRRLNFLRDMESEWTR